MTKALENRIATEQQERFKADNSLQKQLNDLYAMVKELRSEMFKLKSKSEDA